MVSDRVRNSVNCIWEPWIWLPLAMADRNLAKTSISAPSDKWPVTQLPVLAGKQRLSVRSSECIVYTVRTTPVSNSSHREYINTHHVYVSNAPLQPQRGSSSSSSSNAEDKTQQDYAHRVTWWKAKHNDSWPEHDAAVEERPCKIRPIRQWMGSKSVPFDRRNCCLSDRLSDSRVIDKLWRRLATVCFSVRCWRYLLCLVGPAIK